MKTWRERIAEARARGRLSLEDSRDWCRLDKCPAAVAASRYGITGAEDNNIRHIPARWAALWRLGTKAHSAASLQKWDECERLLDSIEDTALELKRQQ